MKILVPVKRVIDYNVKVRVKADQSGVEFANVKMAMNLLMKSLSNRHYVLKRLDRQKKSYWFRLAQLHHKKPSEPVLRWVQIEASILKLVRM